MSGALDMGHARAVLGLGVLEQVALAKEAAERGYSVRQTEELARRASAAPKAPPAAGAVHAPRKDRDLARLEEELSDRLATRVVIAPGRAGRGRILIDYAGLDQLQGILDTLRARPE